MNCSKSVSQVVIGFVFVLLAISGPRSFAATTSSGPLRFTVSIAPELAKEPVSGRLLLFMTRSSDPQEVVQPSFFEFDSTWVASIEVLSLTADEKFEFDPDVLAYPQKFSSAPAGDYQIMALLDVDHTYAYSGIVPGDLRSVVLKAKNLNPAEMPVLDLTLTKRIEDEHPIADTDSIKLVTFQSPLLSAYWGRPIEMRAAVVLPPGYTDHPEERFPVVYRIHGFGGSHKQAWTQGPALLKKMADGSIPRMINVFLDGSCPMGHHEFADSVNDGPWGAALTREFIPYIESKYRADGKPAGRFLTGHSSGGWSTMWLQVTYPDFFGGTWSTSPDPVDFRSFSGIDLTTDRPSNFYDPVNGKPRNVMRYKGRDLFSWKQYSQYERVVGEHGGQVSSFEAVFGPRGIDGRPMPLFNRETGAIDPFVQRAWRKYDISEILRNNWKQLGPKLRGKLHLVVGTDDNFHLEEAVYFLRDTLKQLGSDATFEIVQGRDHLDLYQSDLGDRIVRDMYAVARPAASK